MRTMTKGERLPKHDYKKLSHMDGRYEVYDLYLDGKAVGITLYKPRHKGMPRKISKL